MVFVVVVCGGGRGGDSGGSGGGSGSDVMRVCGGFVLFVCCFTS